MYADGLLAKVDARLDAIRQSGLLRQPAILESRSGVNIRINGRDLINFCSNDYLGLASHPRLAQALADASGAYGIGSSASPLVCGKTEVHAALEDRLAAHYGLERALLFSCGYMANLAAVSALVETVATSVLLDRYCHASMVDAVRASARRFRRYPHRDIDTLERWLKTVDADLKLVLTESVFSMDGDVAPLGQVAAICRRQRAVLFLDDAHGLGVLGSNGRGGLDHFGLGQADVGLVMTTFGKSLGVQGAVVAGKAELIELVLQTARPYIYSTSLPIPIVAAVHEALSVLEQEPQHHAHLLRLISRFREGLATIGITPLSDTPIQPLIVGGAASALKLAGALEEQGIFVSAIRPPTVPRGTSRLRVTLTAAHNSGHVDRLLESIAASSRALHYPLNNLES